MKYYNDIQATERVHRSLKGTLLVLLMLLPTMVWGQTPITNIAGLNAMTENGNYIITADIEDASTYTTKTSFTGTLTAQAKADGTFPVISGLTQPLFTTANGATISNIMLKNVQISKDGDVGAIACTANGATKIYNCGILPTTPIHDTTPANRSKVGSSNGHSCGSLVGMLAGTARVINCFSHANITKGGTESGYYVGGLVGNNSTSSSQSSLNTIVVNCIFYGDIDTNNCANFSPVYGNTAITNNSNTGINPYNFFCEDAKFPLKYKGQGITPYNQSWPVKVEYLTRFEYYRSIFNSNRQLMAWWVTGNIADTAFIAKWVLDPSISKYPILKKWGRYPSIINPDTTRTWDPEANNGAGGWQTRSSAEPYRGKKLGTLSITVTPGTHAAEGVTSTTITRTITDMDTLNHDYSYYKVQLPYYNELFGDPSSNNHTTRYGGNYKNYVVTGWKVTAMRDGSGNEFHGKNRFEANWESGYNFADRQCTGKDLYDTSGRVFAQGGFFYVPDGVSAITIEAYWGKAVYLHNKGHYLDRVNITNTSGNRTTGYQFANTGTLTTTFQGQTVWDEWYTAVTKLDAASTSGSGLTLSVYDQAIVLLSNYQLKNQNGAVGYTIDNKWHPYTIMSIDQDLDNEPDYCFELQFRSDFSRPAIQPIRFDFLPVPELGMAVRHSTQMHTIGIFVPQGHFEITETSWMHTTQFEYDGASTKIAAPVILNGGHFEQIVVRYGPQNNTQYFIMGGHFRMLRFTPGAHTSRGQSAQVRLCAVNAIGGEYPEFYLSGIYRPDITPSANQGNPHCYISGGRFDTIAGAGYDKINGNITFKIDHSLIGEFYGGGINGSKPVGGNIDITIDNSLVRKYCGGPKVGNMASGKTVTTHATGTHFGRFYGGGNGGTSYYREQGYDGNDLPIPSPNDSSHWANYCKNTTCTRFGPFNPLNTITTGRAATIPATVYDLSSDNKGYHALYEFECFVESNGLSGNPTLRTYTHWAQFGTTRTGSITNILTDCTIDSNFYGGGNLGNVGGDALGSCGIESILTNCTIKGNAYGGGFSGKIEPFRIHDKKNVGFPYIDDAGVMQNPNGKFSYVKNGDSSDRWYTWSNASGHDTAANATFQEDGKWYCYTRVSLQGLGAVSGNVTLTIGGNTTIGTLDNGNLVEGTGNVYGGGDESAVNGNTTVKLQDGAHVLGNVYGGGNNGTVGGKSSVTIQNP